MRRKLKAAVDTNDPPTVQDVVDDYQNQLQLEPAARHQPDGQRAGDGRRVADAPAPIVASQPAVREALRRPRELQPAAAARRHAAAGHGADLPIGLDAARHPRHAERRLPARRCAGGAAEGDHRQRDRVRHGRADPGDDAAARRSAARWPICCAARSDARNVHARRPRTTSALPLPLSAAPARGDAGGRAGGADPPLAHRAAAVPARDPHRAGGHRGRRRCCSRRCSASPSRARSRGRWRRSPTSCARWRPPAT